MDCSAAAWFTNQQGKTCVRQTGAEHTAGKARQGKEVDHVQSTIVEQMVV